MQRSHAKSNPQGYVEEMMNGGDVTERVRVMMVENKRMAKRIQILQTEIEEKINVIAQLKNQLDEGVIESTQQKLHFYRAIQDEIEKRVKEAKQQYIDKTMQLQQHNQHLQHQLQNLEESLNQEISMNNFLLQKIQSLKEYIVNIIEEKDYLIAELGSIINQQEQASFCKNCKREPPGPRKKSAVIRRNLQEPTTLHFF